MTGPQFLLLYAILGLAANIWLRWHYDRVESASQVPRMASAPDPYLIALLRDGSNEAIRVALFALIDRDLLEERGGQIKAANGAGDFARRPIELALIQCFQAWRDIDNCYTDPRILAECETYRQYLVEKQLLAGDNTFAKRRAPFLLMLIGCYLIGGLRITNAFIEGRHNVLFLIVLMAVCGIFLRKAHQKRITGLGIKTLQHLEKIFGFLQKRLPKPGSKDNASFDATVVAAVFGLAALDIGNYPLVARLQQVRQPAGNGSGGCGGGGCGGGGCGGGCGG